MLGVEKERHTVRGSEMNELLLKLGGLGGLSIHRDGRLRNSRINRYVRLQSVLWLLEEVDPVQRRKKILPDVLKFALTEG